MAQKIQSRVPLFLPNPRHALLPFRKREKESTLFYPLATESVRRNFSPSSSFFCRHSLPFPTGGGGGLLERERDDFVLHHAISLALERKKVLLN